MIGMNLGASDNALAVDKKSSRHRQFPRVITIESLEIDAESVVKLPEFFRQGKGQTEFIRIFVVFICQYRESESMLFHDLFRILVQLGRNGDDQASPFLHPAVDCLQSFQLCITVRSPDTTIKTDGKRSFGQKIP